MVRVLPLRIPAAGWGRESARRLYLAIVIAAWAGGAAHAAGEVDCRALARDTLYVELASKASATRRVAMRPGETIQFAFQGGPGPFGILALVEGPGAPRMLLVGPTGTEVSFTARQSGAFAFQFTQEGRDVARFTVTCSPPAGAHPGDAPAVPATVPAAAGTDDAGFTRALNDAVTGAITLNELPPIPVPAGSGVTVAPKSTTGVQMNLHWLDERNGSGGANGPRVDASASGLEVGVNYRLKSALTVGALAQVNPAQEMLLGSQRVLYDQGWMAGPMAMLKIAPDLILDARAAWGESGSGSEEAAAAAAQRRLVTARLSNQQAFGAWRLTPSINFNYQEQILHGAELGAMAPHATGTGRVDGGPELAYHMDLPAKGFIEPRAVVGGFWDFDALSKAPPPAVLHPEMRLKAGGGVTIGVKDGPKLEALGGVEAGDREVPD